MPAWRSPHHPWPLALAALVSSTGLMAQQVLPAATPLRSLRNGLQDPARVATDASGRIYITDAARGTLFLRDEAGRLLSVKRGLAQPLGLAVDTSGRVYLGEGGTGSVSIRLADGTLLGQLGQGLGEFALPNHIAVDPGPQGLIYVADSAANLIKIYTPTGTKVREFGGKGTTTGLFDFPTGLFVSTAQEVFVADQNNNRIQVFTPEGQFLRSFGRAGMMGTSSPFGRIQGMAGDAAGRIFVADAFQGQVHVLDSTGKRLGALAAFGELPGQLSLPLAMAVDRSNRLWVASPGSTRIEVFGLDTFQDPAIRQAAFLFEQAALTRALTRDPGDRRSSAVTNRPRLDPDDRGPAGDPRPDRDPGPAALAGTLRVAGVDPHQILWSSVRINGVPVLPPAQDAIQDGGESPATDLRLRVAQPQLLASLPDGESLVFITGRVSDGTEFEAATTVTVSTPPAPARGPAIPRPLRPQTRERSIR